MTEPSKKPNHHNNSVSNKRSFITRVLTKLKRLGYSFKQIVLEKEEIPEPINSLSAKVLREPKEIEKIQPYLNRLHSALASDSVTNIALTGTYGSGKSTVIRAFQDIHKTKDPKNDYSYLNISLASFKDEILEEDIQNGNGSNGTKGLHENFERLLEVSILQQMIYHVKPSRIPDSRFKRIVNLTSKKLTFTAVCFTIWIVSVFSLWKFDFLEKMNPSTWTFSHEDLDWIAISVIGVFLVGLINIVHRLIRTFGNSRISKINIKGELELGENVDKSILNQHLDEIIYFFQKTKFNVVVIEDLDRFRDTEIFTKLREINLLLNNSELINRKIVFVYAIRDDMFQGKERIKFFDYIIPVIPFINPSNANDKLTELLREQDLVSVFSQSFIDNVVTFIDDIDMRLLTNILQEYLVYKESLQHDLIQDNLLAIVIYKNIYPRDFAKLHNNEGDLHDFIANKGTYIEKMIDNLDEEISVNQKEIQNIETERTKNEKELKEVYLYNLISQLYNPVEVFVEGEPVVLNELMEEDNFSALKNEQNIHYNSMTPNRSYGGMFSPTKKALSKSFADIEKGINSKHTFEERLEFINQRNDNKIEGLKEKNELLEERKEEIKRWDLKQIFQTQDVSKYLGAFEDSILMRSLLVNGYINENYLDYISLFHEVNITKGDFNYIRKVKSSESLDFDYKIEKMANVVRKIDAHHFEKFAILNHGIVTYILKNKNKNQSRYKSLKKLLKSEQKPVIDFIDNFKKSKQTDNALLFKELAIIWKGLWGFVVSKNNKFSEKKVKEYFQLIVQHAAVSDIKGLVHLESFKEYFSDLNNLDEIVKDKDLTEKLKVMISSFNTKFGDISELNYNNDFLNDFVIENDHYEINTENLLAIAMNEGVNEEQFNSANYTTMRNLDNKLPLTYIQNHIEKYVTEVHHTLENSNESEEALIALLNNPDLTIEPKKLILEFTDHRFQSLSDFKDLEIKEETLNQRAVIRTWENVMHYFNDCADGKLDTVLTDYLNDEGVYKVLGKGSLSPLEEEDETKKKLALAIIWSDDLSLESHKALRACHFSSWSKLSKFENLSYDKVESMIESRFIELSVDHYDRTKDNFSDLHIKFIERNFATYIKAYDEYEMGEEDHSSIMKSSVLIDAQKKQFLDTLDENKIIENSVVANLATKVYVHEKVSGLSYGILHGLFKNSSSDEYRIKLFNLNVGNIDKSEAVNLIDQLGYPYCRLASARKQVKLPSNPMYLDFTNSLRRLGVLSSNREKDGIIKAVASPSLED